MKYIIETEDEVERCADCFCVSLEDDHGESYSCNHPEHSNRVVDPDAIPRWCQLESY